MENYMKYLVFQIQKTFNNTPFSLLKSQKQSKLTHAHQKYLLLIKISLFQASIPKELVAARESRSHVSSTAFLEINSIILFEVIAFKLVIQRQVMLPGKAVTLVCLLLLVLPPLQAVITLSTKGKDGSSLITTKCNIQTTLDFQFSSNTNLSAGTTLTNPSASTLKFLTAAGNDVTLTLQAASYQKSSEAIGFVTGYGSRMAGTAATPTAALILQFGDTAGTKVYVYIPVIDVADNKNPDITTVDSFSSFALPTPLSTLNFLDQTLYNQWYTVVVGSNTVLVSNFIYKVSALPSQSTQGAASSDMTGITWDTAITTTGDKLCYASTSTTGNFQTHIRESVPLWFAWFWIFFFWLFYLCADSTNVKVFDNHYENNRWTSMSLYSLANLAHEEYYTRLSRVCVILINWSIQGVIIACIYGNQFLGAPMIIWTAAIAFVATLPVPFLLGYLIHKKIYEKNLIKYENMKAMKGVIDKEKLEPHEQAIDTCEEKLYGYYHWLYSAALVLLFICFPIAINQMQKLPRTLYHYHWYWLASMGIVFALEYLIYEPLLVLIFGSTNAVRTRGGHFYNFKLGQAYRAAQTY